LASSECRAAGAGEKAESDFIAWFSIAIIFEDALMILVVDYLDDSTVYIMQRARDGRWEQRKLYLHCDDVVLYSFYDDCVVGGALLSSCSVGRLQAWMISQAYSQQKILLRDGAFLWWVASLFPATMVMVLVIPRRRVLTIHIHSWRVHA